jgi:hypothetical protein
LYSNDNMNMRFQAMYESSSVMYGVYVYFISC